MTSFEKFLKINPNTSDLEIINQAKEFGITMVEVLMWAMIVTNSPLNLENTKTLQCEKHGQAPHFNKENGVMKCEACLQDLFTDMELCLDGRKLTEEEDKELVRRMLEFGQKEKAWN